MSNETTKQPYIPALGFDWLTRFYDPVLRVTLREEKFKRLKRSCPGAKISGLDGDPKVLAIARQKIAAAGVDVELHEGMAIAPPFAPAIVRPRRLKPGLPPSHDREQAADAGQGAGGTSLRP